MKVYNLKEKPYKKSKQKKSKSGNQISLFQGKIYKLGDLSFFDQALEMDFAGNPSANDLYLKAIEEGENISDACNNLGILEVEKNKIKAFGYFLSSLKHNPSNCEAHFNIANLYYEEKDFNLAKLHYEIAAEIDPYFANTFYNLALSLIELNDLKNAEYNLNKYISLVGLPEGEDAAEIINQLNVV